jgi:hypothetical protein
MIEQKEGMRIQLKANVENEKTRCKPAIGGFEPYDSKIKWFSVDNMGTTHEHVGDWETPDHLFIEHDGIRGGKKYVEKIDFVFNGKTEFDFTLVGTLDGVEAERGEAIFHKK